MVTRCFKYFNLIMCHHKSHFPKVCLKQPHYLKYCRCTKTVKVLAKENVGVLGHPILGSTAFLKDQWKPKIWPSTCLKAQPPSTLCRYVHHQHYTHLSPMALSLSLIQQKHLLFSVPIHPSKASSSPGTSTPMKLAEFSTHSARLHCRKRSKSSPRKLAFCFLDL